MLVSYRISTRGTWQITNKTYHQNTPEDDSSNDIDRRRRRSQSLCKGSKDDDDQLEAVHALPADNISKRTKTKLANDRAGRGSELDGSVRGGGHLADARVVDNAEHGGQKRGREDVVRVGEEPDARDDDSADMIPAERSSVNLREGQTAPLVDVLDVSEVIVLGRKGVSAIEARQLLASQFLSHDSAS